MAEEKRLKGHLKIGVREDAVLDPAQHERLTSPDLSYKLDGVELGGRLGRLKFEVVGNCVVAAEMTLYLTDVEVDAPLLEILTRLEVRGEEASEAVQP